MLMVLSSRLIFMLIGVILPIAAHKADVNQTHSKDQKCQRLAD